MPTLHIQLLSDFQLADEAAPIRTVNQPRLQSLLACLLLHRHAPQSRQHLAFTFWPDVSEAQARNNLRQSLHQLRHALPNPDQFLQADAGSVQWLPDAPYRLDVAEFESAIARAAAVEGTADWRDVCQALQQAAGLYAGDLLPSCYDDWITPERDRLRQQCVTALNRLVYLLERLRDYGPALDHAQRLL